MKKILLFISLFFATVANAQTVHDCRIHHISTALQRFDDYALIKVYLVSVDGSNLNPNFCPDQNYPSFGSVDFAVQDAFIVGSAYAYKTDRNLGIVHFNVFVSQGSLDSNYVEFYQDFTMNIN